jgi:hypothetical protein
MRLWCFAGRRRLNGVKGEDGSLETSIIRSVGCLGGGPYLSAFKADQSQAYMFLELNV